MWEFRSFEELDGRRAEAIRLANNLRPLIKPSQPVLYHGTRYAQKILRSNELRWPDVGLSAVHFSRQLHTSAYWALLPREDDEGKGAVFVLDRERAHLRLPKRRRAVLKPPAPAVLQQEWSEPHAMAA